MYLCLSDSQLSLSHCFWENEPSKKIFDNMNLWLICCSKHKQLLNILNYPTFISSSAMVFTKIKYSYSNPFFCLCLFFPGFTGLQVIKCPKTVGITQDIVEALLSQWWLVVLLCRNSELTAKLGSIRQWLSWVPAKLITGKTHLLLCLLIHFR